MLHDASVLPTWCVRSAGQGLLKGQAVKSNVTFRVGDDDDIIKISWLNSGEFVS